MRVRTAPPVNQGENHPRAKLTNEAVRVLRARRKAGERVVDLAKEYGIHKTSVSKICSGERYCLRG